MRTALVLAPFLTITVLAQAQTAVAPELEAKVIAWRRGIHEHPEFEDRESCIAGIVQSFNARVPTAKLCT